MNDNNLYNWLFHKNTHTGNWRAVRREDANRLFSEPEANFLFSKSFETLEQLIIKTDGDEEKIKQLFKI